MIPGRGDLNISHELPIVNFSYLSYICVDHITRRIVAQRIVAQRIVVQRIVAQRIVANGTYMQNNLTIVIMSWWCNLGNGDNHEEPPHAVWGLLRLAGPTRSCDLSLSLTSAR